VKYTYLLIALILISVFRGIETILFDVNRSRGKVYANWTLFSFGISYALLLSSSILECVLVNRQINPVIATFGACLMAARFSLKFWAFRTLGEYYSSNIEIRKEQKLARTGPYKYLRHPAYLSNLIDFIALPLLVNSFYTILWAVPVQFILVNIRIHFEEKALVEKFGEVYNSYKAVTGGLLPFVKLQRREKNEDSIDPAAV
jgi:protein-S-isoprenylcysteine O-methyltransferase Ste14